MPWFILACSSGSEARMARHALTVPDCQSYYPIERRWPSTPPRTSKPREVIERPAMPGYLFVGMPTPPPFAAFLSHQWHNAPMEAVEGWGGKIYQMPTAESPPVDGAIEFLGDGEPREIEASVVDSFRQREEAGEFDFTVRRGRHYLPKAVRVGATVSIVDGPLVALCGKVDGIITRIKDSFIVAVTVDLFKKKTVAEVPIAFLRFNK